MNLKHLSDEMLDQNLKTLVTKEREVLGLILLHIKEVDLRKLYLALGYQSLFAYLTEHVGYANGSAQRRIDAARLSVDVPTVIQDIANGDLNLSQVNLIQESLRQKAQEQPQAVKAISSEVKSELVENLKNKSMKESQVLVSQAFDIELKVAPKVTCQKDGSVRLEMTLTKEQWAKLEEMRKLLSNSLLDGSWDKVFEYVADKVISQKTKGAQNRTRNHIQLEKESAKAGAVKELVSVSNHNTKDVSSQFTNSINTETIPKTNALTPNLKKFILLRDECCQYKSKLTGKVCGSYWHLEVDHIKPRWAGGTNNPTNLRVLCGAHNKEVYRQQAGIRRV